MDDEATLTKDELERRIDAARAALDEVLAPLSESQLVAAGPEGWSVKDHLTHLTAWERGIAAMLERRPRYEAMGVDQKTFLTTGEDALNAIIYEQNKGRSAPEALAALRAGQRELSSALAGLSDADLRKTYSHYQPGEPGEETGAPIIGWVVGNTYDHYDEHLGWIRALVT